MVTDIFRYHFFEAYTKLSENLHCKYFALGKCYDTINHKKGIL